MNNPLSKTPFLFLLIALVFGVVLQYYGVLIIWSIILLLIGGMIMLLSFFITTERQYAWRWLFGVGVFLSFVAVGAFSTYVKQQSLVYPLNDSVQTYIGYVTTTPQEKPRSIAYMIHLRNDNVDVVCYFQKDSTKILPDVGDEIMFVSRLQHFKNSGNPHEFDYEKYIYNQGFVASAYASSSSWILTGKIENSISINALKLRQKIINLYSSLGFTDEERALLSALTLGYQDTLSDDLKEGFRITGTVHVLSVSGLHVGIIYGMIVFLLSFIPRSSKAYRLRPLIAIVLIWFYAYITGLPPSVVRASIMITAFCMAEFFERKNNPLNSLYIAAFVMLLYNPFQLFDIGFQLSCLSVLSILILYPRMLTLRQFKSKFSTIVWQMFCISVVAQLATFPLCLYYFGTFPTYFFLANLIIVPLVSLIIYATGFLFVVWSISTLFSAGETILWLPINIVQWFVEGLTRSVKMFENLPLALLDKIDLSFVGLLFVITAIIALLIAVIKSNSKSLIVGLTLLALILVINISARFNLQQNRLVVYNRYGNTEIEYFENNKGQFLDSLLSTTENPVLNIGGRQVLIMNDHIEENKYTSSKYKVDYAIITGEYYYSLSLLNHFYQIDTLILDGSLKSFVRNQLTKECEKTAVAVYDVTKKGAFSINF